MSYNDILKICYLFGSLSFIVGLKMLSKPDTARKGNLFAALGMTIAIVGTMIFHQSVNHENGMVERIGNLPYIFIAIAIGTVIGWIAAMKVKMTAMPQMVSLFNGMGGACAALISIVEMSTHHPVEFAERFIIFLSLMIGTVSFAGSMIAYGKLEGKIKDYGSKVQQVTNNTIVFAIIALIIFISMGGSGTDWMIWIVFAASLVYGVLFVLPIGGADMPVVISLLNSFTGIAAACGGFLYDNQVMLTGGILVGSAGTILTILMCKAMNRSLWNVISGAFSASGPSGKSTEGLSISEISVTDVSIMCAYAQRVVIVPGYGLAVAQAQHTCHEFEKALESKGVEVNFAIHPVAGRMPGHMNVLLAEADVPYDKLKEMDDINPQLPNTDVVIVIGANDVVNPAAETDPSSPIYGMPIIKANTAKNVIVMKRSMAKGYAGIENELFYDMTEPCRPIMVCGMLDKGAAFARRVGVPADLLIDTGHPAGLRMRDRGGFGDPKSARNALLIEAGQHWERSSVDVAIDTTLRFLKVTGAVDAGWVDARLQHKPAAKQRVVRVTQPITAASKDFRFALPWKGLEVIEKAGTVIATDGDKVWRTPYDACVLVMPSTAHVKPGNTMVRLGRYDS